jgi:hypothetical protein
VHLEFCRRWVEKSGNSVDHRHRNSVCVLFSSLASPHLVVLIGFRPGNNMLVPSEKHNSKFPNNLDRPTNESNELVQKIQVGNLR